MKTLDEVIAELEDEGIVVDALHYLKTYRDSKAWLELEKRNYAEAVRNCDTAEAKYTMLCMEYARNDPLTWDELRQMEGKPVWVEWQDHKEWFLIDEIDDKKIVFRACNGFGWHCNRHEPTWQAYRKEKSSC